jgi:hypothetical protein
MEQKKGVMSDEFISTAEGTLAELDAQLMISVEVKILYKRPGERTVSD